MTRRERGAKGATLALTPEPLPSYKLVSVRQQAAEAAERAGRTPCFEVAHGPECPGNCGHRQVAEHHEERR